MVYMAMSGKKRARIDDNEKQEAPLALGTFRGTSIYRNRRHAGETFEQGHVSIHNLVLPETHSALVTTFVAPEPVWLEQVFFSSTNLLIISGHDKQAPLVGHACIESIPHCENNQNWLYLKCTPHTGGCLHPKLLLFRNNHGLRVVVSGNNFFQRQWQVDRDTMWIQDFYYSGNSSVGYAGEFASTLTSFVSDLTKCQCQADNRIMQARINDLLQGIDFTTAKARLVISFPRNNASKQSKERGGYRHLASVVRDWKCQLEPGSDCEDDSHDDNDDDDNNNTIKEGSILYATSGSFGNVQPDFLLTMYQAFVQGDDSEAPKSTPWNAIYERVKCLWPSRERALSMNLLSLIGNTRAIPRDFWKKSIPNEAKRRVFLDAPPNPPTKGDLKHHAVSHAKCMYYASPSFNIVYVGSHNFSKSAWGLRGESPKNVELGVVLATKSSTLRNEWKSRLPCILPKASETSPPTYIPASAHSGIREKLEEGKVDEAVCMTIEWLSRKEEHKENENETISSESSKKNEIVRQDNVIKADIIDLCDSD